MKNDIKKDNKDEYKLYLIDRGKYLDSIRKKFWNDLMEHHVKPREDEIKKLKARIVHLEKLIKVGLLNEL